VQPTQTLPIGYQSSGIFDLKSRKILIGLNVVGILLVLFFLWFFGLIASLLRTDLGSGSFEFSGIAESFGVLGGLLASIALVLVLHEAVHGAFFWIFTRHKPVFGFKGLYAYAAMPGWYIPRNQYLVVGIAPFILLSLLGVALIPFIPLNFIWFLLIALVMNASGAVGDLAVVFWLLTKPTTTMALDQADSIELFILKKE
jgi:hypothetical protein